MSNILLTSIPFRCAMVGKSMLSGKSTVVSNLLGRDDMMRGKFKSENIFIWCPTIKHDETYLKLIKKLKIPIENIQSKYSEASVKEVCQVIKDDYQNYLDDDLKPPQVLFIFDDIGTKARTDKRGNVIDMLATMGRHFNISFILPVQNYNQLSTTVRRNLSNILVFNCTGSQFKTICLEHDSVDHDPNKFKEMLKECTRKKHNFMHINYNNGPDKRYSYNFEKHISSIDDIPQ